jgi:hypothetical protein
MTKHNWPTREEWAYRQQHPYWDSDTGCPFEDRYSHRLSDYATPEEIAAAVAALENLWRQHGRRMRDLKLKGSPLYRQPNEKELAFLRRLWAMSKADMDVASGSNLTFESPRGFPADSIRASLTHANRNFHHSKAR